MDKSPQTPGSTKSSNFEVDYDLDEQPNNGPKVTFSRQTVPKAKARATNSNTLPSLSSIDENGTGNEDKTLQFQQEKTVKKSHYKQMKANNEDSTDSSDVHSEHDFDFDSTSNGPSSFGYDSETNLESKLNVSEDEEYFLPAKLSVKQEMAKLNKACQRYIYSDDDEEDADDNHNNNSSVVVDDSNRSQHQQQTVQTYGF